MANIIVVANLKVKSEFRSEVYKELLQLHTLTHQNDAGCIQYDLHVNLEDTNSFTFIETWENAELLGAHMQTEHFVSFMKNTENKIKTSTISKLKKV